MSIECNNFECANLRGAISKLIEQYEQEVEDFIQDLQLQRNFTRAERSRIATLDAVKDELIDILNREH